MTTIRPWTDADTETFLSWFVAEPTLAARIGLHDARPLTIVRLIAERQRDERDGRALIRAIDDDEGLAAHVTVSPILAEGSAVHICLAPRVRGRGFDLARAALAEARRLGLKRLIAPCSPSADPRVQQRWLRRVGFQVRYYGEVTYA